MKKIFSVFVTLLLSVFSLWGVDRIIVLNPAGAEILYALGAEDKIIARTDFCNYPEAANSLPSVGGFDGQTLSIEKIISLKPDFVYGSKGMHDFLKSSCDRFGIELYLSEAESIQGVLDEIIFIGSKTGSEKAALELSENMKTGFEKLKEKTAKKSDKKKKRVYWETWNSPYMSVGKTSFINELIEVSGGKNIFSDIEDQAYPVVSEESILMRNPEIIILPYGSIEECSSRNGWKITSAVKQKKIFNVNDDIFSRPGPRILEAAEILYELVK